MRIGVVKSHGKIENRSNENSFQAGAAAAAAATEVRRPQPRGRWVQSL